MQRSGKWWSWNLNTGSLSSVLRPLTTMLHYISMEKCVHEETQKLFHQIGSYNCLLDVLSFSCSWENMQKKKKKDFVVLDGMVNPQYQDEIKLLL